MKSLANFKKKQSGFTLVELGIVVAIAAVIIGISLVVVPGLLASTRANAEVSELPAIATKIQRAYANQPNYATLTHSTVVGLKVFPESSVAGTVVTNRWGGLVTIAPFAAGLLSANDAFTFTTTGVPSVECVQVVQSLERSARAIAVGAVQVKADAAALNLATLGTNCGLSNSNTLVFTFGK